MERFEAQELRAFLEAADRNATESRELLVIGGTAAAVQYRVPFGTTDVDVYEGDVEALASAFSAARAQTGLAIPVSRAAVAELPFHHRDRVVRMRGTFRRLLWLVPERHDLVLSKLVRGHEMDLRTVEALHRLQPLDIELLVVRYVDEMKYAIGSRRDMDLNLLVALERIGGDDAVANAERVFNQRDRG